MAMGTRIGRNAVVGVALNGATTGVTFGGTPGSYDYFRGVVDGMEATINCKKSMVEEMDCDSRFIEYDGTYYTGTVKCKLSYSYREKVFQLWMGGALVTTLTGPYLQTISLADQPVFGAIEYWFTDAAAQANALGTDRYTDALITNIKISQKPAAVAEMEFSWISAGCTRVVTAAAMPTINETEFCSWRHLAPTLNTVTTLRLSEISIEFGAPMTEGEFDLATATQTVLQFIDRAGGRTVKFGGGLRLDAAAETLLAETVTPLSGTNTLVWDNAGASTANRKVSFTFGTGMIEGRTDQYAGWGRRTVPFSVMVQDGTSPRHLALTFTNARTTISA